jgi:ABC-type transport system substrate-binding protein
LAGASSPVAQEGPYRLRLCPAANCSASQSVSVFRAADYSRSRRQIGWTDDNGDPDNWLGMLLGCDSATGGNVAKFCYKPFDDRVKEGRETTDIGQRTRYCQEAQEMFAQQLPFSPIAHSTVYQPIHKNVTDFKIDPFGPTVFSGVGLN